VIVAPKAIAFAPPLSMPSGFVAFDQRRTVDLQDMLAEWPVGIRR
jgi:hypothetical protein